MTTDLLALERRASGLFGVIRRAGESLGQAWRRLAAVPAELRQGVQAEQRVLGPGQ